MTKSFCITASAPGKLMLLGEHAVLDGNLAIVSAINCRVKATVHHLDEPKLIINSELGDIEYNLNDIPESPALPFVTEVVRELIPHLTCGVQITIASQINPSYGLGSSAATCAAACAALMKLCNLNTEAINIFQTAKCALQRAQTTGSGADLAASVFGGSIAYCTNPFSINKLKHNPQLDIIYTGSKLKTQAVINIVAQQKQQNRTQYANIFRAINNISLDATHAIQTQDWQALGKLFTQHQKLQHEMQLTTPEINAAIEILNNTSGNLGAKISGAGLGDCVIAVKSESNAAAQTLPQPLEKINLSIDTQGVVYERE